MKKIFVLIIIFFMAFFGYKYYEIKKQDKEDKAKHQQLIKDIANNYNKYVKVTKDADLYKLENDKYIKKGTIGKEFVLELEELKEKDNEYFKIKNMDYYINYKNLNKANEPTTDERFKSFIPFEQNVSIKPNTKIYIDDSYITLDEEINSPLIIKDDNKYGFIYNDKLFYVSKEDCSLKDNHNSDERKAEKVLTLTYHFIYDPNEESCNQSICQTLEQFEGHLKFLKDENYFVAKVSELEMFIDGKINLPYNSIVLTIDDGHFTDKAIRLLEKYETYATLFVITGHFKDFSVFKSPYLSVQSHTDNMHNQYECSGMGNQGGGLLCIDTDTAVKDIQTSKEKIGNPEEVVYLSYPFFDFNDHAIETLKKAGIRMAFIGQWTQNGFASVGTNKYKVPRLTVFNDTTVDELRNSLKY